jgi:hypothetical protein
VIARTFLADASAWHICAPPSERSAEYSLAEFQQASTFWYIEPCSFADGIAELKEDAWDDVIWRLESLMTDGTDWVLRNVKFLHALLIRFCTFVAHTRPLTKLFDQGALPEIIDTENRLLARSPKFGGLPFRHNNNNSSELSAKVMSLCARFLRVLLLREREIIRSREPPFESLGLTYIPYQIVMRNTRKVKRVDLAWMKGEFATLLARDFPVEVRLRLIVIWGVCTGNILTEEDEGRIYVEVADFRSQYGF